MIQNLQELEGAAKVIGLLGFPAFVLLYLCVLLGFVVKRTLPHALKAIGAFTESQKALSAAVPEIKDSIQHLARTLPETLARIETKVDGLGRDPPSRSATA